MFDVIEVDIGTRTVRLMSDEPKSERNAKAIEKMAIMRRSTDHNYFTIVDAGKYKDGELTTNRN